MMKRMFAHSASCAGAILKAWQTSDLKQLEQELATASALECDLAGNAGECERLELLRGIATAMRNTAINGQVPQAGVYISVLQHLAQPVVRLRPRACSL
ncbi:hypothetical protein SBA3_1750010 [Candidatus Sulfopaludibacter sp. SbA3]|nr:hypothetical protein SBA3_1750010 [Candidatus Sulfopaludibacter sp. SbA3]